MRNEVTTAILSHTANSIDGRPSCADRNRSSSCRAPADEFGKSQRCTEGHLRALEEGSRTAHRLPCVWSAHASVWKHEHVCWWCDHHLSNRRKMGFACDRQIDSASFERPVANGGVEGRGEDTVISGSHAGDSVPMPLHAHSTCPVSNSDQSLSFAQMGTMNCPRK